MKMKKLLSIMVCAAALLCGINISAQAATLEGKGTELNPFLISNETQLRMLADFPDACWRLTNDIELTETWTPISEFSGTLDGDGYAVSGLYIYDEKGYWPNDAAFISVNKGAVKNLVIKGSVKYVSCHLGGAMFVYENYGVIENCSARGEFELNLINTHSQNYSDAGGFVSHNMEGGIIRDCYARITFKYTHGGGKSYYAENTAAFVNDNDGLAENCYSASVGPSVAIYGFMCVGSGAAESCYYDKDMNGISANTDDYGKSTAAMKMEFNYKNWDFENVWAIDETVNDGYPYLRIERSVVVQAVGMTLDKTAASVAEGGTVTLTPVFAPANATNQNVTWATSNRYVATVDENGVVTGVSEGTAKITATSEDGGYTAYCAVTVTNEPVVPDYPNGACGENLTWKLENGVLTVSGSGEMTDFDDNGGPWCEYADEIKAIVVENGAASIGECAFMYCAEAESVSLPEGLKTIKSCAFYGCEALLSINIPASVTEIVTDAFDACYGLKSIAADENSAAFSSADGVLFNKSKTELLYYPEGKADAEYTVPGEVGTIAFGAFYMNFNLEKLYIPDSVTMVEDYAILLCNKLTIYASSSSCAKAYAEANNIAFVATDASAANDYTVNYLTVESVGNGCFRVRANVTKNSGREGADAVIIALYGESGEMADYIFMEGEFAEGQTVNFGGILEAEGGVKIRAFVWDSLSGMKPLSNAAEKTL